MTDEYPYDTSKLQSSVECVVKIKRCPFCGGEATLLHVGDKTWQVKCNNCGASSDYYDEEWDSDNPPEGRKAIEAWNRRSIEDTLQKNNLDLMEKPNEEDAESDKLNRALAMIDWKEILGGPQRYY